MFYDRFTDEARKVMAYARQEAQRLNHDYIGTEHILLGLIKVETGVAANLLRDLHVDTENIRIKIEKVVEGSPEAVANVHIPFTPRAKKVIEHCLEESRTLSHDYIGTEHILLGLLRETDGVAAQVLMELGLELDEVREEVRTKEERGRVEERPVSQRRGARRMAIVVLITALITSLCWYVGVALQRRVGDVWLESAVKAPGRMALDEIHKDLTAGQSQTAKAKLEALRKQWRRFESGHGFTGEGIGNIMVEFSRLSKAETEPSQ